jgi:replicative DNA helicase
LDEQPGMTISEMKAKARKIQREYGLDYMVIDYLGLIQGNRSYANRVEEVSENSRLLKMMAKELNIPVIVLCQLSRAVEQRATNGRCFPIFVNRDRSNKMPTWLCFYIAMITTILIPKKPILLN